MMLQKKQDAEFLLRRFIQERLDGEIDGLADFDFRELENHPLFGCPERTFDVDNSNLANAIYILLWGDQFPNCNGDTIGIGRPYRGDTMNTFHTMFGRPIDGAAEYFAGLEKYEPSNNLREQARKFHHLCRNIGNFILLPNISVKQKTINTYRGTNDWKDFFDIFLLNLERCLNDRQNKDGFLSELLDRNGLFFERFRNQNNLLRLGDIYFLDDYLDKNGMPKEVFIFNCHWMNTSDRQAYLSAAEVYLFKTEQIITRRGKKMIMGLKNILNNVAAE